MPRPLRPLSVDGDLERPLEASLLRPPLNNKLTKVLERCRVLFSSGSFPFCFFSFFCLISVIWTANNNSSFSFQLSRHSMTRLSARLTCHGDLALGPADGSARPAESQQHGGLRVLALPSGLLRPDHGVPEQSGSSQAAGGVRARPLRGKVRLDGGLGSLRLGPEQPKHHVHVCDSPSVPTTVHNLYPPQVKGKKSFQSDLCLLRRFV